MLEDNQLDVKLIKQEMIEHEIDFTSKLVETEKDFIEAIYNFKPDLILSDYSLPQFTGFEALKIVKKLIPDIPVIIVTGFLSEETAIDSIKAGAWNYILKDNLIRLAPAIKNALKLKEEKNKKSQAEKTLKESEAHYHLLFNTLPYSAEILDLKGNILDCNTNTLEMLGYKRNKIIGRNINEFADAETLEFFHKNFSQAKKGEIRNDEARLIHKNGNIIHVIRTVNPIISTDGVVKNLLALNVDITKLKKAEEKIKEQHKNIDLLYKIAIQFIEFPQDKDIYTFIGEQLQVFAGKDSYVAVNSIDREAKILTTRAIIGMGKFTKKIIGLLKKHPVGMTYNSNDENLVYLTDGKLHLYKEGIYGLSLKTIPKVVSKSIEKLLNIKKILTIGFTKDNNLFGTIIISFKENVGELQNKKIIELFVKQASIMVQKRQAEEALKNSEERLNILFESAPDAYYLNDFTGKFIDGNKAAEKLLGYPREELIGKNFVETGILYPNQAKKALDVLKRNINGESAGPDEYTLKRKDGSKVEVEILTHPVTINNEKMVLGIARDITKRKQAEKKLESKMKQLILINDITIGREITLNETRKEVNELLKKLGKEEKYKTI